MSKNVVDELQNKILSAIDYYRNEYESITYAEIVGILELVKQTMIEESYEEDIDVDEEV